MAKVVVVDLASLACSEYSTLQPNHYAAFTGKIEMILEQTGEVNEPVYLMGRLPYQSSSTRSPEKFVRLTKRVRVLQDSSVSALLYTIKREMDNLDLENIIIITSNRRKSVLQKYQELLFTALYHFEYLTVFEDPSVPGRSANVTKLTDNGNGKEIADVKEEVSTFLRQLPPVGDIVVLASSTVPGKLFHVLSEFN